MNEKKILYIKELTNGISHGSPPRPFFAHLSGVSELMNNLFGEQYLTDAGLYHSVYGTSYFKFESSVKREEIKALIGSKAENLVYTFCSLESRTIQILQNKFESDIQKDLYKLEYANILEQSVYYSKHSFQINQSLRFQLKLIKANLKDHFSIELPPATITFALS